MKYLAVVEKSKNNYAAYVPDLPGCIATGSTVEEVQTNIRSAIAMHVEGMREDGLPIPEPQTQAEFVEASSQRPNLLHARPPLFGAYTYRPVDKESVFQAK